MSGLKTGLCFSLNLLNLVSAQEFAVYLADQSGKQFSIIHNQ